MFNNVRDRLYSVVQDGIDLNNSVFKKISEVQQVTFNKPRDEFTIPINKNAGAELLNKYQDEWKNLHEAAEVNAQLAENIDGMLGTIHSSVSKQLTDILNTNAMLATLPQLSQAVEKTMVQYKELAVMCQCVEQELTQLEDLIEQCDFKERQREHILQLTMYKEKKFSAFEKNRISLAKEQAGAAKILETKQRESLLEKQRVAQEAFIKDLVTYKEKGMLPSNKTPEDENINQTLEDIQLDNEDTSELDDFLSK